MLKRLIRSYTPLKPEGQMHLKPSERSKHVPLFLQGDDWHSSMWISHKLPEKPRGKTRQSKARMRGVVEIPMPTNYKMKFPTHKELGIKVQTNLKSLLSLRAIRLPSEMKGDELTFCWAGGS